MKQFLFSYSKNYLSMTEIDEYSVFRTPQRNSKEGTEWKNRTTTIGSKFGIQGNFGGTTQAITHLDEAQQGKQEMLRDKERVRWFQSRLAALKIYLCETSKVSKRTIFHILGWNEIVENNTRNQQQKILKNIGTKVQSLLKVNNQLISYSKRDVEEEGRERDHSFNSSNRSPFRVKKAKEPQEDRTQICEFMIRRSRPDNEAQKLERRSRKKDKQDKRRSSGNGISPESRTVEGQDFASKLVSIQQTTNLKRFFTLYINTCVEENDQKFAAAYKYVQTLENRIVELQTINNKIDHLKFQKEVKLQQTNQKVRNISIAGPNIQGDDAKSQLSEPVASETAPNTLVESTFRIVGRQLIQKSSELQKLQYRALKSENQMLSEQVESLKVKFQKEIEAHIRDKVSQEELLGVIRRLQAENRCLKGRVNLNRATNRMSLND